MPMSRTRDAKQGLTSTWMRNALYEGAATPSPLTMIDVAAIIQQISYVSTEYEKYHRDADDMGALKLKVLGLCPSALAIFTLT